MSVDQKLSWNKSDHALELYEKGISRAVIAVRLGVRPSNIGGMLQRAKERREKREADE
jgi:hypothetical protein